MTPVSYERGVDDLKMKMYSYTSASPVKISLTRFSLFFGTRTAPDTTGGAALVWGESVFFLYFFCLAGSGGPMTLDRGKRKSTSLCLL